MTTISRHNNHDKYKNRITHLFKLFSDNECDSPEAQANNAKYLAVLISGYLEQAIKELLLHYVFKKSSPQVAKYVEGTWPTSKNMTTSNITDILRQFNSTWGDEFETWQNEDPSRKSNINSIISWRNNIAHGNESNTTGVTLVSVKTAFISVNNLVAFIENKVKQ